MKKVGSDPVTTTSQPKIETNHCQPDSPTNFRMPSWEEVIAEDERERVEQEVPPAPKVKYDLQAKRALAPDEYKASTDFYIGRDINVAGLRANAFRLLAYIKSRAGKYGHSYYCSVRDIVKICKLGQRAVEAAITELEKKKFIQCEKQDRKTTKFTVLGPEHWCTWLKKTSQ
jgi:DNA-binding MarR family transcriptional regulator